MAGLTRAAIIFDRLLDGSLKIAHVREYLLRRFDDSECVDDLARVKRGGVGPAKGWINMFMYVCMYVCKVSPSGYWFD